MAEILSYSCPATETVVTSDAPPNLAVPPGLLAEPNQRTLRDKLAPQIRRRCVDGIIVVCTIVFAFGSLADLCVFGLSPVRNADVIAGESGRPTEHASLQVAFTCAPYTFHNTQEISERFYDSLQLYGQVQVHVIKVGSFAYVELQRPWSDFLGHRWWFFAMGLLTAIIVAARLYWRLKTLPEQNRIERSLGLNGQPIIARVVKDKGFSLNVFGRAISYQYIVTNGPCLQTTSRWYVSVPSALRISGAPLLVVYDPDQPAVHRIYDLLPFVVERKITDV